jgi:hypothetical protein
MSGPDRSRQKRRPPRRPKPDAPPTIWETLLGAIFGVSPRGAGPIPPPPFPGLRVQQQPRLSALEYELLRTGYRHMALKYHPDNQETGDPEKFKALVDLKARLNL